MGFLAPSHQSRGTLKTHLMESLTHIDFSRCYFLYASYPHPPFLWPCVLYFTSTVLSRPHPTAGASILVLLRASLHVFSVCLLFCMNYHCVNVFCQSLKERISTSLVRGSFKLCSILLQLLCHALTPHQRQIFSLLCRDTSGSQIRRHDEKHATDMKNFHATEEHFCHCHTNLCLRSARSSARLSLSNWYWSLSLPIASIWRFSSLSSSWKSSVARLGWPCCCWPLNWFSSSCRAPFCCSRYRTFSMKLAKRSFSSCSSAFSLLRVARNSWLTASARVKSTLSYERRGGWGLGRERCWW